MPTYTIKWQVTDQVITQGTMTLEADSLEEAEEEVEMSIGEMDSRRLQRECDEMHVEWRCDTEEVKNGS